MKTTRVKSVTFMGGAPIDIYNGSVDVFVTLEDDNPGCAGGPRSITVLNQSKSSEQDSGREITGHDGVKGSSR